MAKKRNKETLWGAFVLIVVFLCVVLGSLLPKKKQNK
jgi:cbb3-type cytochrome oxidase subunit 3